MIITNVWNQTPASSTGVLTASYTSNGGYVAILFAGSAWSTSIGTFGVNLNIDGSLVTSAKVTTNEANSHKALVLASTVAKLSAGPHTITISPTSATTKIDNNDFFTLTLTELSFS